MRKQFTFITILILICGSMSFGQTATLGTAIKSPGETVIIPLTVSGWNSVGAITLNIRWKKDVLTFTGITGANPSFTGYSLSTDDSTIYLAWSSITEPSFNGVLFNLNFVYNGITLSPLHFLPSCLVSTGISPPVPLAVTWTDGAVNPKMDNSQTATLGSPTATTGSLVTVPLMYAGFGAYGSNVGSITQKIHFDTSKLSFVNISATGNLSGAMAYASNGVLTISWSSTTGKNIDFPANQININFIYNGNTSTVVRFYSGSLITTNTGANIPVSYFLGTVSPGPSVGTAVLGNINGALQGHDYLVPLTLATLPGISSMTLKIIYDNPRLSFIKDTNDMVISGGSTVVYAHGDTISIVYTNGSSPSINGIFLKLKFHYGGIGVAHIMFGPGCLFTDNLYNPIQTAYTNATITPAIVAANATIESVSATPGSDVLDSIVFSSLPTNIGAVSMNILFDSTKLNFIDAQNNIHGATVWSPSPGKINISWASITATNINGTFLKLRFHYLGGGGAAVAFTDGCEVANISAAIVPVNWNNGGVNIYFTLSGFLTYDSSPNPVLALGGVTVYLKDMAEPLPPNTTPIPNILYSVITDGTGYFQFIVPNGTYYIYAASTAAWAGANGADVTNIRRYIALLSNTIGTDVLRQHAADINQDGIINGGDVTPLRRRIANLTPNPNYLAPDWLFENPSVTISGANATRNFMGTCSGDVNGSYPF